MNKTHQSIKDQRQKRSALSDLHLLSWSLEGANVHFCYGLPAAVVLERISRKKRLQLIATVCIVSTLTLQFDRGKKESRIKQ